MNGRTWRVSGWTLLILLLVLPLAVFGWQWLSNPDSDHASLPVVDRDAQLRRGEYLARAGNCMACHTARGGAAYAGGRVMPTPFGNLVTPNITPDVATGIGRWSADDFWRAMHNGRGRNGEFLYPAFPYPNYTRVTREDSDALYAWLRTVPAIDRPNEPHALRFPYDQRFLLAFWRALYFRPGVYEADDKRPPEWNRGAYLVQGLGHCNACHAPRNLLGATRIGGEPTGGVIPMLNWYAPSLAGSLDRHGDKAELVSLLRTGVSNRGAVYGPMAEVVRTSLQHLSDRDVDAMAVYLQSLPPPKPVSAPRESVRPELRDAVLKAGAQLYEKHCVDCHGAEGKGKPPAWPSLAGAVSLTSAEPVNALKMVLHGGFPPSTAGNPRPHGMPPYGPFFSDDEIAAVVSFVRTSWGNGGGMVSAEQVARFRSVPVE